jgi:selenide,water dikinase
MLQDNNYMDEIKLTSYSHGFGCGCKIAPSVLDVILKNNIASTHFPNLIVGNKDRDDAAVFDLGNGSGLISTTDFFMPIVDNPYDFGRIAATNAISDVYAMGGSPVMALAILGWPVDKISPEIASEVLRGGRSVCEEAGIPLAGGHSIDSPEPIFGLSVNGFVDLKNLKKNNSAEVGDLIFLTKSLGVGIITTAVKKGIALSGDLVKAIESMTILNKIGVALGQIDGVHAMTDITGFGLFGHLIEMAEGSKLSAKIDFEKIPILEGLKPYLDQYSIPAITYRNWNSYSNKINEIGPDALHIGCDPQTSGGLLIAVKPSFKNEIIELFRSYNLSESCLEPLGTFIPKGEKVIFLND